MSVVHGQMAEWIKMPLGTEVGLSPGHTVIDGEPAPIRKAVQQPPPTLRLMSIVAKRSPISATAVLLLFMVALCNRADHYIFILFLSSSFFFSFFSSTNLSGRRLDVYHTSAHGVVLV